MFFTPDSHAPKRRRRRHLIDSAAAEKFDQRVAATGQNHPARRRRKNDVGAELYCHTIFPDQLYAYQHFTAGERALAGLTMAPPLDMGCWGRTTQLLGRNVSELGGRTTAFAADVGRID